MPQQLPPSENDSILTHQKPSKATVEDVPVTLKVSYDGLTRRHKLGLREVGVSSLENKIRHFLAVPADVELLLERYSDSANAYIVLDPINTSVYKQLYRAAKAKQKLKLRVTRKGQAPAQEPSVPVPRSVTVEDVPEPTPAASAATPKSDAAPMPILVPITTDNDKAANKQPQNEPAKELPSTDTGIDFETSLLASLMKRHANIQDIKEALEDHVPSEPKVDKADERPSTNASTDGLETWFARASTAAPCLNLERLPPHLTYAVCCNSCDKTIPGSHYHCGTCDDGDFDLCQSCVDLGITCHGENHWLIKRSVRNGQIIASTTEIIAPKPKTKAKPAVVKQPIQQQGPKATPVPEMPDMSCLASHPISPPQPLGMLGIGETNWCIRTCNCCVRDLHEREFVHCTVCDDFDLCHSCFTKDGHGHNPKHGFEPVGDASSVSRAVQVRLGAGRNQAHNAICDGCDAYIYGVRHKCLECPDWDYCADCHVNAGFVHQNHRFVPIYEPLPEVRRLSLSSRHVHHGICCDGPLCQRTGLMPKYISGVRYKCTVCHDTDFCANCEANPALSHNKSHPLLKIKTPIRHISVTTTGEQGNGEVMPQMGDQHVTTPHVRAPETTSIASVRTVADVQPVAPAPVKEEIPEKVPELQPEPVVVKQEKQEEKPVTEKDLVANFISDTVADGTTLPANHVFQQTWVLRNEGDVAWPAGSCVKFVGGDYMGHVDSNQPAGITELVSASESTVCYEALQPGQCFPFTVLLRTPAREGKFISYWRLTSKDGLKFGHRLWCDISVKKAPEVEAAPEPQHAVKAHKADEVSEPKEESAASSQMIFPKLEKESPVSSVHQDAKSETTSRTMTEEMEIEDVDDFEDCSAGDGWNGSDDGFMTDEEYDILDASDEEYLEQQEKRVRK